MLKLSDVTASDGMREDFWDLYGVISIFSIAGFEPLDDDEMLEVCNELFDIRLFIIRKLSTPKR